MPDPDRIPLAEVAQQWDVTQLEVVEAAHTLGYSTTGGVDRHELESIRREVTRNARGGRHHWLPGESP